MNIHDDIRKRKMFIESIMRRSISDDYVGYILSIISGDIFQDLEETADENYNEDDVKLAIGRVLCSRFGIEV